MQYERRIYLILGFVIAAITGVTIWFGLLNSQILWIRAIAVGLISVIEILFFWKVPDYLLADWVHKLRSSKFKNSLEDVGIYEYLELFDVDWKSQRVLLREDKVISIENDSKEPLI